MSQEFVVQWLIELHAETPEEAARLAWNYMRAPDSTAKHFTCIDEAGDEHDVDLLEIDQKKATEEINGEKN